MVQIDMEMPKNCKFCPLHDVNPDQCPIRTIYKDDYATSRFTDCPLYKIAEDTDTISRKAAIDAVMEFMPSLTTPDGCGQFDREIFEAQEMFVDIGQALNELPSAQPEKRTETHGVCLDAIDRQATIDALEKVAELFPWRVPGNRDSYDHYNEGWNDAIGRAEIEIEKLPSAQPEVLACGEGELIAQPEIVRCKDCKHKGTKNCVANAWTTIFGVMVKDDFYCGLAERRIDDTDTQPKSEE